MPVYNIDMQLFKYRHRREGPDKIIKAIKILSFICLLIILIILALISIPQRYGNLFREISGQFGAAWDKTLLANIFYLLLLQFAISTAGIIMNSTRYKRRDDKYSFSLIISSILSVIGIILYLIFMKNI